jgi:phosphoglycolate phosphatase
MFDVILFDLDGTLTDPGEGITNSVAYALEKLGLAVPERRELYKFIGPPLLDSFQQFYGLTLDQARQGVRWYREYFQDKGMLENVVYDGIPALLADLRDAGKTLLVATSKPEVFSRKILEHFDLARYFTCIAGASLDETRTRKDQVIAYALGSCGISAADTPIMVGDREHDILGAQKNGLRSIGVLYGYGSYEELAAVHADYIVETVSALGQLLL